MTTPSDPGSPPLATPPVRFRPAAVLVGLVLGAACYGLEATGPADDVPGALLVAALFVAAGLGLDLAIYVMRKRGGA